LEEKHQINDLTEEQSIEFQNLISQVTGKINSDNFDAVMSVFSYFVSPSLNDLSLSEIQDLETSIANFKNQITKEKHSDSIRYCNWLGTKLDINLLAKQQEKDRQADPKKLHPIRPRRGEVYLTQLGENVGKELNDQHLALILQNDKGNLFGNTVVCIPISSSGKLYPTHEKIVETDIKSGRLDKLPSKAKTEQIQFLDKARLIHKVAVLEDELVDRICVRLKKNLDIK
jgi:mRNA-degrading endonuclease toxin of MazEF toxin-antitoxin module